MSDNFISIIIPTFNRIDSLIKGIENICNQDFPSNEYEIIIVDDGSTDDTGEKIKCLQKENNKYSIQYFKQENKGPATARNLGIKNAKGNIILFIGDDIIPAPHFIREHSNWHKKYPQKEVAILGYTTWSPELTITPYMKWLENGGPQFHYQNPKHGDLKHGQEVPYNYFYTSNVSVKMELLRGEIFNEMFPYAAYEDSELAYRLKNKGLKIVFNKNAEAYHYHKISLSEYSKRAFRTGISRVIFLKLHPELPIEKIKTGKKSKLLFNKITMPWWILVSKFYETRKIKPILFGKIYQYYLDKGIKSGLKSL
jgi:glycosyltransferase involved in cell wall biosynthesis